MKTHNKVISGYTCISILLAIHILLLQKTYSYCTKIILTRWELLSPFAMTGKGKELFLKKKKTTFLWYKLRQNSNIHNYKVILVRKASSQPWKITSLSAWINYGLIYINIRATITLGSQYFEYTLFAVTYVNISYLLRE